MNKKIYIIEDDELTQKMIRMVISKFFENAELVGSHTNGQQGLSECIALQPDLAIVDIRLPDVNGLEILHILKKRMPHTKVLIYSGILRPSTVKRAYFGNADGILEKSGSVEELKIAIEKLLSGDSYYSRNVTEDTLPHNAVPPFVESEI